MTFRLQIDKNSFQLAVGEPLAKMIKRCDFS